MELGVALSLSLHENTAAVSRGTFMCAHTIISIRSPTILDGAADPLPLYEEKEITSSHQPQPERLKSAASSDDGAETKDQKGSPLSLEPLESSYLARRKLAVEDKTLWNQIHNEAYWPKGKRPRASAERLTPKQKQSLYWARRFLFSALIGNDEPLEQDPASSQAVGFTSSRLAQVLKAVNITATPEEVDGMMEYWQQLPCPHSKPRKIDDFCKHCWIEQEDQRCTVPGNSGSRNSKRTSAQEETFCDWEQFCYIFDACNLKAETNGRVW